MLIGALLTPSTWGSLWITVPILGAVGYLANQHPRRWGWMAPTSVAVWLVVGGYSQTIWGWLMLGTVATISLLGLAEDSPVYRERRLWAFIPLLVLAVLFPLSSAYGPAVSRAVEQVEESGKQAYAGYEAIGIKGAALISMAEQAERATNLLIGMVENALPAILFTLACALVAIGALLARRIKRAFGWGTLSSGSFSQFHMPEGLEWVLVLGLAAIALRQPQLNTVGLNVAICLGVGYWLQGLAVGYFVLLGRGFRPGIIWILFIFVLFLAPPVLLVASTLLGIADVWLDVRRRRQQPGPEEQEA
jgi:hypothetical protein